MMNTFFLYYLYINLMWIIWHAYLKLRLLIIKLYRLIRFHYYALGPFILPDDANEIYDEVKDDPLDSMMKQKRIKPVLFIQYFRDIQDKKVEKKAPPPATPIVFKPLPPLPVKQAIKHHVKEP